MELEPVRHRSATRSCSSRAPTTASTPTSASTPRSPASARTPTTCTINGDVTVDAAGTPRATRRRTSGARPRTCRSSRSAAPTAGPCRRPRRSAGCTSSGDLNLGPRPGYGWASGGYIADSRVDGSVASGSQQQWYTRDSNIGSWDDGVWNMVFSGVQGAPAQRVPEPAVHHARHHPGLPGEALPVRRRRRQVPRVRAVAAHQRLRRHLGERHHAGHLAADEPVLRRQAGRHRRHASTPRWPRACNLFFTPGIYHLNQTLNVTRANTVVLGLGYPTLIPDNGVDAMQVADVDGVQIAGLLFDAGTVNSPALLTVGPAGSSASHAANPTTHPGRVLPHRRRASPARPPTAWSSTATTRSSTTSGPGAPTTAARRRLDASTPPTPA